MLDDAQKEGALMRQARILKEGVSREAFEVLEELAGFGLPVFQFRDRELRPLPYDAQTLALMAAVEDGKRELVLKVRALRKLAQGRGG